MLKDILAEGEDRMQKSVEFFRKDLASVRAGRANPAILDKIVVDYYGAETPLNQLGNIAAPEPRLLTIAPWDKSPWALSRKPYKNPISGSTQTTTAPSSVWLSLSLLKSGVRK